MAKAKKRAGARRKPRVTGVAKNPEEIQKVRNRVVNLIVDKSVEMTERVVRSVSEHGNVTALRFLWQAAGMFPAGPGAEDEDEERGGVAQSLLEKLGLYEEAPRDEADPDGDVESEESQPAE